MLSDMQGIRGLKRSSNKNRAVLRRVAGEGELALRVFVLSFHCAPRSRLIPLICNLQFYNRMGKRSLAARIRVLCSLSNINAKQKPRGTNALKTLTSGARTRRSSGQQKSKTRSWHKKKTRTGPENSARPRAHKRKPQLEFLLVPRAAKNSRKV